MKGCQAVEIDLTGIFGLEGAGPRFDDHKGMETEASEQQGAVEILSLDIQMHLPADKSDARTQGIRSTSSFEFV